MLSLRFSVLQVNGSVQVLARGVLVIVSKTNCDIWLIIIVAPPSNQSKEVEYSGYLPSQAVQVISLYYLLRLWTRYVDDLHM